MERVPRPGVGAMLCVALAICGCANLQTINRESGIPLAAGKGRAIHLDAQQRMVVFAAHRFCAEPSPDALAAYASALGLGASHGSKSAANAATSLNSVAGSIGLRTQSITLMRDTLYRTCEAAMNGSLSDEQVAMLMARSQDLTAVVLAIEQLTGTVAAPPVTLTPGGAASGAAALLASTEALNAVGEAVSKAETERKAAETLKTEKEGLFTTASSNREKAYTLFVATPGNSVLEADYKEKLRLEGEARSVADQAERDFDSKDSAYQELKKTQQRISLAHDSTSLAVSSSVTSGASLGSFVYHSNVNDKTGTEIAEQVGLMVRRLLYKDYFAEACMATIMRPSDEKAAEAAVKSGDKAPAIGRVDPSRPDSAPTVRAMVNGVEKNVTTVETQAQQVLRKIEESRDSLIMTCIEYFKKFEPHYLKDPDAETAKERVASAAGAASQSGGGTETKTR